MAAKILSIPIVWDNHGNIKGLADAIDRKGFFLSINMAIERRLLAISSMVLLVSENDRKAYDGLGFNTDKLVVIPTSADTEYIDEHMHTRSEAKKLLNIPQDTKVILFFGTLRYAPNMDAVKFIIEELSPQLMRDHPEAIVYIAGAGWDGREIILAISISLDSSLTFNCGYLLRTYASHQCGRALAF